MAPGERLRGELEKLHAELARARSVDEDSRALLHTLAADIERVLEQSGEAGRGLRARVEQLAVRFETDHPRLAATLNQLTDSLARMGI
jgi:hypothetical protein